MLFIYIYIYIYNKKNIIIVVPSLLLLLCLQQELLDVHLLRHGLNRLLHVGGVDDELLALALGPIKADLLHDLLRDGDEPACADVLHGGVDVRGHGSDLPQRVVLKDKVDALRREHRLVLHNEVVLGLRDDAVEVLLAQRLQLDADGQAPLQLREHVRRLHAVEGPAADKEDLVRLHLYVRLGRHGRALHERQQVLLDALRGRLVPLVPAGRGHDLVDLVDDDDAVLLTRAQRLGRDVLGVHHLVQLFLQHRGEGVLDLHHLLHRPRALVAHHGLHVQCDEDALAAGGRLGLLLLLLQLHHHLDVIERAGAQVVAEAAVALAGERLQDAILRLHLRLLFVLPADVLLRLRERRLVEVLDDAVHVAAVEAHLRELGRLHLHEGRVHQLREPPRNLCLAHAGGAYHEDVLRRDLLADVLRDLVAPPAVPQRHRDRLLRIALPYNVAVQLLHQLARLHVAHEGAGGGRRGGRRHLRGLRRRRCAAVAQRRKEAAAARH
ncbi:ATP-dependent HslUV protease ATP-binding protein subunit HslU [Strigomonas culicis]|uniref:ATP-dependent HslUV protease ATP-binding protein subunit HslU n=1 Tax=Strigomonas culicis TaxID=28005 RepID=S9W1C8_9TRYP|nr:ATP-dependent HslUV protease ATP-binding protein subunit HslU [Strigomonas culicis]|eukprot:EPY33221.1 ATP-dependent HslUV protease ATP-binding protein subunit HslU [Strigomonas culicis]